MSTPTRKADGTVYAGDPNLVHIADGKRADVGRALAVDLEARIRWGAVNDQGDTQAWDKPACPGCYMVAIFNAAVALAKGNGQSLRELGRSLGLAFNSLAEGGEAEIEAITVVLDSDDSCPL